jgi:acyl carrier protein
MPFLTSAATRVARLRSVLDRLTPPSLVRERWRRAEEEVEPRVRQVVAEHLGVGVDELTADVSLADDLAADSLDLVELCLVLEDKLRITIPDAVIDDLRFYGQVVEVVETLVRQRRAADVNVESSRVPALVFVKIVPPDRADGEIERVGWLTPYTAETIVEDALRAGDGSRLELAVPPNLGERAVAELEAQFAWLGDRHVEVSVRRDTGLRPLGSLDGVRPS